MPHAGGGGHSGGGSHNSGGSNNSFNTKRRYDHRRHIHSRYYLGPGFYYAGRYVPYEKNKRTGIRAYAGAITFFIISLFFIFALSAILFSKGNYSEEKLESYAFDQYAEIYDEDSSDYEKNILVTFVTYEDNKQYDYFLVIGDNVSPTIDELFNSDKCYFVERLRFNFAINYDYSSNIYERLSNTLESTISRIDTLYSGTTKYYGSPTNSSVINKTPKEFESKKDLLENSEKIFFEKTGYNITFLITDNNEAYGINWPLAGIMIFLSSLFIFIGAVAIIQRKKDLKIVNSAIKEGKAADYFEGEDPFEEYYKSHPFD